MRGTGQLIAERCSLLTESGELEPRTRNTQRKLTTKNDRRRLKTGETVTVQDTPCSLCGRKRRIGISVNRPDHSPLDLPVIPGNFSNSACMPRKANGQAVGWHHVPARAALSPSDSAGKR